MKIRTLVSIASIVVILALLMLGCTLSTTLTLDDEYDVRIVNESGRRAKVRWDKDSYRYLDDGCIISIPVEGGYYELEWEDPPQRSRTRSTSSSRTFRIRVDADIDIVFRDDPDVIIIER